ncbi:MAG: hypothetical protein WKG01_08550 [Kofleriaceae bacterium]
MRLDPDPDPGTLLIGADWAIAHGDAGGLAYVAAELGMQFRGSIARELLELAHLCESNFERAANRWPILRARLGPQSRRETCSPGGSLA